MSLFFYYFDRFQQVKNTVKMYGPMRTVSHTFLDEDEPAPEVIPLVKSSLGSPHLHQQYRATGAQLKPLTSNATLEDLTNYERSPDIQSHEDKHKQLPFSETTKPAIGDAFPMTTATTVVKKATSGVREKGKKAERDAETAKHKWGVTRNFLLIKYEHCQVKSSLILIDTQIHKWSFHGGLIDWLIVDWSIDWLIVYSIGWLIDLSSDLLNDYELLSSIFY